MAPENHHPGLLHGGVHLAASMGPGPDGPGKPSAELAASILDVALQWGRGRMAPENRLGDETIPPGT